MRDNTWLAKKAGVLWIRYFSDIDLKNEVIIRFGRKSRTRLGSISVKEPVSMGLRSIRRVLRRQPRSLVIINGYLKSTRIPDFVVEGVIAHELTHYAHGFCSPHRRKFLYPHRGGVVKKELQARGLNELIKKQDQWIKQNWRKVVD